MLIDSLLEVVFCTPGKGLFTSHGNDALAARTPIVVLGRVDGHCSALTVEKPVAFLSDIQGFTPGVEIIGGCVITRLGYLGGSGGVVGFVVDCGFHGC